jgi:hypothetical protein
VIVSGEVVAHGYDTRRRSRTTLATIQRINNVGIVVKDLDAAIAFFTDLAGSWKPSAHSEVAAAAVGAPVLRQRQRLPMIARAARRDRPSDRSG